MDEYIQNFNVTKVDTKVIDLIEECDGYVGRCENPSSNIFHNIASLYKNVDEKALLITIKT